MKKIKKMQRLLKKDQYLKEQEEANQVLKAQLL
jgi:hypothetical protein